MKAKFFVVPAIVALSSTLAFAQTTSQTTTQRTTESRTSSSQAEANRGVPGVDVDMNRSRVGASVGASGDQRNVDTRTSGAAGSDTSTRAARADRN